MHSLLKHINHNPLSETFHEAPFHADTYTVWPAQSSVILCPGLCDSSFPAVLLLLLFFWMEEFICVCTICFYCYYSLCRQNWGVCCRGAVGLDRPVNLLQMRLTAVIGPGAIQILVSLHQTRSRGIAGAFQNNPDLVWPGLNLV